MSGKPDGPRHSPEIFNTDVDSYNNLILLCRVHHKMIDDQVREYSEAKLHEIKSRHESWVRETLEPKEVERLRLRSIVDQTPKSLSRISGGKKLFNMILGSCGAYQDHPEPRNEDEANLIAGVLQEIQDSADMGSDLDSGERVTTSFRLSELIKDLEVEGLWLFGATETKILEGGIGRATPWKMLHISIVRANDARIFTSDQAGPE